MKTFKEFLNESTNTIKLEPANKVTVEKVAVSEGYKLFKTTKLSDMYDVMLNNHKDSYFSKRFMCRYYGAGGEFYIADFGDKPSITKGCNTFTLTVKDRSQHGHALIALENVLKDSKFTDISDLFTDEAQKFIKDSGLFHNFTVREKVKSSFNPFFIDSIKPLSTVEEGKLRITTVYQIIANGQYKGLVRDGKYTDDYAYDASVNFGKGAVSRFVVLENLYSYGKSYSCWVTVKDSKAELHIYSSTESFTAIL